jgi:hypothetical protein
METPTISARKPGCLPPGFDEEEAEIRRPQLMEDVLQGRDTSDDSEEEPKE